MGYIDVYVVHPTAASYLCRATAPLRVAAEVEAMQNAKYAERGAADHAVFFHSWLRRCRLGECVRVYLTTDQTSKQVVSQLAGFARPSKFCARYRPCSRHREPPTANHGTQRFPRSRAPTGSNFNFGYPHEPRWPSAILAQSPARTCPTLLPVETHLRLRPSATGRATSSPSCPAPSRSTGLSVPRDNADTRNSQPQRPRQGHCIRSVLSRYWN
jgi:hypothetical protein